MRGAKRRSNLLFVLLKDEIVAAILWEAVPMTFILSCIKFSLKTALDEMTNGQIHDLDPAKRYILSAKIFGSFDDKYICCYFNSIGKNTNRKEVWQDGVETIRFKGFGQA